MRAELYPFFVPGVEVVALATLFDDGDAHGWSRATYGEHWATATLTGVFCIVTDASALLRWEYGDEVEVQLEDIEVNGETLRRAQTALVEQSKPQTRSRTEKSLVDGATSGLAEVEPESEEEPLFTYAGRKTGAISTGSPVGQTPASRRHRSSPATTHRTTMLPLTSAATMSPSRRSEVGVVGAAEAEAAVVVAV